MASASNLDDMVSNGNTTQDYTQKSQRLEFDDFDLACVGQSICGTVAWPWQVKYGSAMLVSMTKGRQSTGRESATQVVHKHRAGDNWKPSVGTDDEPKILHSACAPARKCEYDKYHA
jgi:hypothetical protein